MPSNAEKLLGRARRKKAGWMPHDLLTLYQGFGFIIRDASGSHKFVSHPKYPILRAVIPVHPKELGKKYVADAVRNIDAALKLESEQHDE